MTLLCCVILALPGIEDKVPMSILFVFNVRKHNFTMQTCCGLVLLLLLLLSILFFPQIIGQLDRTEGLCKTIKQ